MRAASNSSSLTAVIYWRKKKIPKALAGSRDHQRQMVSDPAQAVHDDKQRDHGNAKRHNHGCQQQAQTAPFFLGICTLQSQNRPGNRKIGEKLWQ